MLECIKHNGHNGGGMEVTLLHNWVQTHHFYELLLSLPSDASQYERDMIKSVIKTQGQDWGSLRTQLAASVDEAAEHIKVILVVNLVVTGGHWTCVQTHAFPTASCIS
ncbi:hypothetical protein K439DRAFT_1622993 [Ramaria rubella]|nr:hypothetical protein K439DRAFT_1622993 [Ramaria rubella]